MTTAVTLRELLEAGVHFGHQTRRWHPKMKPYIFAAHNGVHIINLQKTAKALAKTVEFVARETSRGRRVLFVGTKRNAQAVIAEEATRAGQYYVNKRWLGGTLTNFRTVRNSIERLNRLEEHRSSSAFDLLSKKEGLAVEREINKLKRSLGGIQEMKELPDVLFVVDVRKEHNAVLEARRLNIPIVAVVDTNCSPEGVDYVLPGNDDALRSIALFSRAIADACMMGRKAGERPAAADGSAQRAAQVGTEGLESIGSTDAPAEILTRGGAESDDPSEAEGAEAAEPAKHEAPAAAEPAVEASPEAEAAAEPPAGDGEAAQEPKNDQ
jgi:small subunit ribosomal protein S2